jgi:hypothetical protein
MYSLKKQYPTTPIDHDSSDPGVPLKELLTLQEIVLRIQKHSQTGPTRNSLQRTWAITDQTPFFPENPIPSSSLLP